jgi:hypothetical protein
MNCFLVSGSCAGSDSLARLFCHTRSPNGLKSTNGPGDFPSEARRTKKENLRRLRFPMLFAIASSGSLQFLRVMLK